MIIIPGPSSIELGVKIAESLKVRIVNVAFKKFPDGESYLRLLEDVRGDRVVIVQSSYPPQDTHLIQLFLLVDLAKKQGAEDVTVVVPYMAYSRQDKAFRLNEAVSIETIFKIFEKLGINRLITVAAHEPKVFQYAAFASVSLSATKIIASYFADLKIKEIVAFAPDVKAAQMAKEASQIFNGPYGWFTKERDRATGEISLRCECKTDVKRRNVVLLDDIISTGETTAKAIRILKNMGAKRVFAACVHPLLAGDAYEKITRSGAEAVIATDTIPSRVSLISVAPLIAENLII